MIQGFGMPQVPLTHSFETENQTRTISLAQDSISVRERQYRQWGEFRGEIERIEGILREIYAPAFYTRVGLRYRDVLDRSHYGLESIPWSKLLNPIFLGVLGSPEITQDVVQQSQSQVVLTIPDVDGGQVLLQHGLAAREGEEPSVYLIDADFTLKIGAISMMLSTPQTNSTNGPDTFSVGQSPTYFVKSSNRTRLDSSPDYCKNLFNWERTPITVLPEAIEAPPMKKRFLTCLLAMYMPLEGVDENLGSALECWNFYVQQPHQPVLPQPKPRTEMVNIVGVRTSPGMIFED